MSGFDVNTIMLSTVRLRKSGGLYEKKIADGFGALEISKGSWARAIFTRERPVSNILTTKPSSFGEIGEEENLRDLDNENEVMPEEDRDTDDGDDKGFDEDKPTEESYRTTFDTNLEDLEMQVDEVREDADF